MAPESIAVTYTIHEDDVMPRIYLFVVLASVFGPVYYVRSLAAQTSPQPPQPPELSYLLSDDDRSVAVVAPAPSPTPGNRDRMPPRYPGDRKKTAPNSQLASPILRSIDAHIREVEAEESRRLHHLKSNIEQIQVVLEQQRMRAEQERLNAEDAQRREREAMEKAEESQQMAVEARRREADARRACQPAEDKAPTHRADSDTFDEQDPTGPTPAIPAPTTSRTYPDPSRGHRNPPPLSEDFVPTPPPQMVTEGAVHQRALADNLFGAGEYKLAKEIYEILLGTDESDPDATWFRYQVANCHRHLGNEQRAATYYRVVAADKTDSFLAENGKWWLDILEKKKGFQNRMSELNQVMEQVRQTVR